LELISGIGKKRRLLLLKSFGSLDAIRKSSMIQLQTVPGITEKLAKKIIITLGSDQATNN
jgi:excinuclease ABC subunit C